MISLLVTSNTKIKTIIKESTPTIDIPYMDAHSAVDELRDNNGI